ncbi:MAG: hypothetical protein H6937_08845 [Burkholderiales bacterium]|nr:hypothetical protein [Burkholderiales bacterium]MDR4515883.1 hypothetical protein [Nitrosomonas sp.]
MTIHYTTCSKPTLQSGMHFLPSTERVLSLYLRRVECLDETEHEGIWPFVGEGIANDAMRLRVLLTWQRGAEAPQAQCMLPVLDLGSNYQDGTVVSFNERLASYPVSYGHQKFPHRFPLTVNASLVLLEEDWGGQMDEVTEKVLHDIGSFVKGEVATATSTAVGGAVGGAIGTALGPLGTAVGTGVGAAVGWIVQQIGASLDSLKTDAFPPQDVSIILAKPSSRFTGGSRLPQQVIFEGHGGKYKLNLEWRFGYPDRRVALKTYSGNYVMAINGGGGLVNAVSHQTTPKEWETFVLEDVSAGQVSLRAWGGQVLSAEHGGGGAVFANRNLVSSWESLRIYHFGNGRVALRAANGKYLCAENGGGSDLLFNRDRVAEWETFTLQTL